MAQMKDQNKQLYMLQASLRSHYTSDYTTD